uniref:Uncharacterized protein LOC114338090 n=1 Tax=Diabrotica virgifera virgifera TaxID=50390 RepID=A0A6P7G609_DIAVI
MIVHHNRLAPYEGDHDVDEEVEVNQVREIPDLTFEEFMGAYGGTGKARHGVTTEEKRDLLALSDDYSLAHTPSRPVTKTYEELESSNLVLDQIKSPKSCQFDHEGAACR